MAKPITWSGSGEGISLARLGSVLKVYTENAEGQFRAIAKQKYATPGNQMYELASFAPWFCNPVFAELHRKGHDYSASRMKIATPEEIAGIVQEKNHAILKVKDTDWLYTLRKL
ncbi:MAG: hypothetical protein V1678_01075 [Candidatus Aenigmatarchaeota archaeon]